MPDAAGSDVVSIRLGLEPVDTLFFRHPGAALDAFVTLCQGAAFVARAHDA